MGVVPSTAPACAAKDGSIGPTAADVAAYKCFPLDGAQGTKAFASVRLEPLAVKIGDVPPYQAIVFTGPGCQGSGSAITKAMTCLEAWQGTDGWRSVKFVPTGVTKVKRESVNATLTDLD